MRGWTKNERRHYSPVAKPHLPNIRPNFPDAPTVQGVLRHSAKLCPKCGLLIRDFSVGCWHTLWTVGCRYILQLTDLSTVPNTINASPSCPVPLHRTFLTVCSFSLFSALTLTVPNSCPQSTGPTTPDVKLHANKLPSILRQNFVLGAKGIRKVSR